MSDELKDKVDRGVQFLDAVVADWRNRIDLSELDLGDPAHCVLGQVFGDDDDPVRSGWAEGSARLDEFEQDNSLLSGDTYDDTCILYGFDIDYGDLTYLDLQSEWLGRIL